MSSRTCRGSCCVSEPQQHGQSLIATTLWQAMTKCCKGSEQPGSASISIPAERKVCSQLGAAASYTVFLGNRCPSSRRTVANLHWLSYKELADEVQSTVRLRVRHLRQQSRHLTKARRRSDHLVATMGAYAQLHAIC